MSPFAVDIIVLIDLLVWGIFIGLFLKCFRLFFATETTLTVLAGGHEV